MIQNFTRFFDKNGNDFNFGATYSPLISLYDDSEILYESFYGKMFFPSVSVGLIESQQIYMLQEITGPTSSFELRKVTGRVSVVGGNSTVAGIDSDFTELTIGDTIKIAADDYTISSIAGPTSMSISPTPSSSTTTFDIYRYDYLSYGQLRTSPGTFSETVNASFDKDEKIFLYDVDYSEDSPFIEKFFSSAYELVDGSSDTVDPLTGRIQLATVTTLPLQVNLGLSSDTEEILTRNFYLTSVKTYTESFVLAPVYSTTYTFYIGGTSHPLYDITDFYLEGLGASGSTFDEKTLEVISIGVTGSNTYIEVKSFDETPVGASNFSSYQIKWVNIFRLANLDLYGETESEDERFKVVLNNFGKSIDHDKEYIFRESDINEDLPDYHLLNKKRKELLLEGDNIYPYLGSYKALINIINFFGYYDLRIKEYFLNVNPAASNFGKYLHILVPKDAKQRDEVRHAWSIVPSKIYKKTSLFGLFYDINRTTENVDDFGIPEVEDAFDFSPEEVLIKLFGLKELLKQQFLPLNARIYDITGEGIYFERIRLDSWADNLTHLTLDLGRRPVFNILPVKETYITDLRRIDQFYVEKFVEQGLTGFLGATAANPLITPLSYTGPMSELYDTYLESYSTYVDNIFDVNGNLIAPIDDAWNYMPPSIYNINFNELAARMHPLPDDDNIVSGGPTLLEARFDLTWEESQFNWSQLGILGPSGAPININLWTWDSIGRGEYIDMRWTIEKSGIQGFYYDSERRPISEFVTSTQGATAFTIPGKITVDITGGSIVQANIFAGYGYSTPPSVFIPGPDTPGVTATMSVTILDGYIVGATFTGGSGYTYAPTVTVDVPTISYEEDKRLLHAVSLPYEGVYDVALYIYDITNGYTVEFQKYNVKNKNVDFASSIRKETKERLWQDFVNISWQEVTGPWYYPIHVHTTWEDCVLNWESLNFSSFDNSELFEYDLNTSIHSIDRTYPTVTLLGNLTGDLDNSLSLDTGDFIFLTRDSGDLIVENLPIPPDSFGTKVFGMVGLTAQAAILIGASGDTVIDTSIYDTTVFLNIGDSIYFPLPVNSWYTIDNVGATSLTLTEPLSASVSSLALTYNSDKEVEVGYTGPAIEMNRYSRIIVTNNCDYLSLSSSNDMYYYLDGLTASGSSLVLKGEDVIIRKLIVENTTLPGGNGTELHASWGMFSGTYAIEITNIALIGGNTQLRLKDDNKELYCLDGNFTVKLADYDVDYAETRIGPDSLTFSNANELTWDENESLTWLGTEYHGGILCGYIIPFVAPSGSISIDEEPTFFFTGNLTIESTKTGLQVATDELNNSTNSGIVKYNYSTLPEDELYVTGLTGGNLSVLTNAAPGATSIDLTSIPDGGTLKIPAEITVTIISGSIAAVTIVNPGYGYTYTPNVSITPPGCTGTAGIITLTMSGLPYAGTVIGATFSPGSGYPSSTTAEVDQPTNYKVADNYIWTGYEWVEIIGVSGATLLLGTALNYTVNAGDFMLMPYQYHKQIFLNPSLMQQFYYFIHGKAVNPSGEMLSYINLGNGVESEWAIYPDRTYTYPLRNSILNLSIPQYNDLTQDFSYQKWVYEGSDYPAQTTYPDYESDVLSYQSRVPYGLTLQSPYSFIDTVISSNQQTVPQFTPVVFHYDNCRIPGKKNPIWTIKNDVTGKIEVMTDQSKLMWNFTKTGKFTVTLQIYDTNGNKSVGQKNSFIVVDGN